MLLNLHQGLHLLHIHLEVRKTILHNARDVFTFLEYGPTDHMHIEITSDVIKIKYSTHAVSDNMFPVRKFASCYSISSHIDPPSILKYA